MSGSHQALLLYSSHSVRSAPRCGSCQAEAQGKTRTVLLIFLFFYLKHTKSAWFLKRNVAEVTEHVSVGKLT